MYDLCYINIELPYLRYAVVLLPQKRVFFNSKRRTQNRSNSLKNGSVRQKDDNMSHVGKVIQRSFKIDLYTYLVIYG